MKKRDYSLDILRILACLMVVGIHTSVEGWYNVSPRTYNWTVVNFYDTVCRPAVPLFVMISGCLFLHRERIGLKQLWLRHILRLLIVYVVWVVFYAVMNNGIHKAVADPALIWSEITGPNPMFHLWYLRMILNLYAVAPLLWYLVRNLDGRYIRYYLILFLIFGIMRRTLSDLPFLPHWVYEQMNLFIDMDLVGYSGYFLLGYWLSSQNAGRRFSSKTLLCVYILTVLLAAGLNQMIAWADDWPTQALYGNFSLPVAVEAVCLFLLVRRKFSGLQLKTVASAWLVRVSETTFFVYLVHPFVQQRLQLYLNLHTTNYNLLFSVPLTVLLIFALSSVCGMLLKRIPVLKYIV